MQQRSDEEGLQGLNWNEHIQKRPEMYIGQIGDGNKAQDGIYALLRDAIDMSVDEFQRGFCKGISIDANRVSITVREFGRGIPLKDVVHATSGVSVGIGAQSTNLTVHPIKVVNALSNVFNLKSYRDGKCSWVKYSKGVLLSQGVEKTQECNGLLIEFSPDVGIFPDYSFQMEIVRNILKDIAQQNKGLSVVFNGETL